MWLSEPQGSTPITGHWRAQHTESNKKTWPKPQILHSHSAVICADKHWMACFDRAPHRVRCNTKLTLEFLEQCSCWGNTPVSFLAPHDLKPECRSWRTIKKKNKPFSLNTIETSCSWGFPSAHNQNMTEAVNLCWELFVQSAGRFRDLNPPSVNTKSTGSYCMQNNC